jgi:hypothetical protein
LSDNIYLIKGDTLTAIADGVRNISGTTEEYTPEEMAALMSNMSPGSSAAVLFTEQNLTESQKDQARANIGAISKSDIPVKVSAFTNDAGYIKNTELNSAVDAALTEAKESGEFKGESGVYVGSGTAPSGTNVQVDPSGGSDELVIPDVLQTTGTSTVDTMSQKAITDALNNLDVGSITNRDTEFNIADAMCPPNQLAADGSTFGDYNEETEELYTGEGCSRGSDFNAFTVTHTDIYGYIDNVRVKYPNYITKEIMGKDASGTIDIPRYIMSGCYYRAYYKENYPKMYAWKNGSTILYSLSISPRIGDSMYSTTYIGTVKGTVSAVDNVNQTRTVGGVVYTKDETKDVEPTLVYIRPTALSSHSAGADYGIYNTTSQYAIGSLSNLKNDIKTAATAEGVSYPTKMNEQIQSGIIYDNNGVNYIRYPFGDRFEDMTEPIKIVIGCNEHGTGSDEAEPSICCARLINDLAIGTDNKMLNWLRKNAIVIAVPIINPYGYDKHWGGYVVGSSYYNANAININRNYDTIGWVHDTSEYTAATNDTTGHSPCGAYAGSENETQYIMNTIALGDVAVSYHTIGATTDLLCAYQFNGYTTQNPNTVNTPAYITKKMNDIAAVMRNHYGWQFVPYGEDFPDEAAKSLSFITQAGCTGGLIEMCVLERGRDEANSAPHTSLVLEACYSEMLMTLYSFINDYDQTIRI